MVGCLGLSLDPALICPDGGAALFTLPYLVSTVWCV